MFRRYRTPVGFGAGLTELDSETGGEKGLANVVNADSPHVCTWNNADTTCQQNLGAGTTIQLEICR